MLLANKGRNTGGRNELDRQCANLNVQQNISLTMIIALEEELENNQWNPTQKKSIKKSKNKTQNEKSEEGKDEKQDEQIMNFLTIPKNFLSKDEDLTWMESSPCFRL